MKSTMAVSILALALGACSSRGRPPPQEPVSTTTVTHTSVSTSALTTTPAPSADSSAAAKAPVQNPMRAAPNDSIVAATEQDRALAVKIKQRLAGDPTLQSSGWNRVRIMVAGGHVTIAGEVSTVADSCGIEHAVREVSGVQSVTNEMALPKQVP